VLSPDGHCRAFDRRRARHRRSGSGAWRRSCCAGSPNALADGDRVHAVLKGSAVNDDGARKVGGRRRRASTATPNARPRRWRSPT
jgi:acyl transferase domain-containing protein